MRRSHRLYVTGVLLLLLSSSVVIAAERDAVEKPIASNVPNFAGATVSIPWSELRTLFADRGPGQLAPVEFVWAGASYKVDTTAKTARMTAKATINVLAERWAVVSLGPAGSSLVSAVENKKPCPVFLRGGQLYALLAGKGEHHLELVLEGNIRRVAGGHQLALPLVPAPIVDLEMVIDSPELDVNVTGGVGLKVAGKGKHTTVTCSLRGDRSTSVTWKPREKKAVNPVISASVNTLIAVQQSRIHYRATVSYEILRASVGQLQILLPEGAELRSLSGPNVAEKRTSKHDKGTLVEVDLVEPVEGMYRLELEYATRITAKQKEVAIQLATPMKIEDWTGHVAIQGMTNADITSKATKLERIDVTELPVQLRRTASRAIVLAYRVDKEAAGLTLALERHEDVRVLIAMCDVCEASTVFTPDGRKITKMMFVTRNNAKPFLTLDMPKDARVWSALVDDRPVTPAHNAKGQLLVPLTKSQEVEEDDEHSYQRRREDRRRKRVGAARDIAKRLEVESDRPRDLKPYDIEIVFVESAKPAGEKGELDFELPKCDIPIGRMAWAVFLPDTMRVVDVQGNLKEVRNFSLPFVHFGEAAYRQQRKYAAEQLDRAEKAVEALEKQQEALKELAESATAEGVLPVRVELPVAGELFRFEKLLLVDEAPEISVTYRRRAL